MVERFSEETLVRAESLAEFFDSKEFPNRAILLRSMIERIRESDGKLERVHNLALTASGMNQPLYNQDILDALR